ncbi:Nucleic acid-binding protein [Corchorus olitorius]|uniref:Nucleic acid-binding protein n=1 Tax=Corchorus olitorius TaxID=93759 RepID=A0A1R3GXS0_9ROSI|nr:Nucleic acid-binding protein [Corchorus olitorius]
MSLSSTKKGPVKLIHARIAQLRPGIRAYVVVRLSRLWETIFPGSATSARTCVLLLDDEGNAIQAFIYSGIISRFRGRLIEGRVFKIYRFQVAECKSGYNPVPSEYIINFNSSTVMEEVSLDVDNYPRHYFRFATMDEISGRGDKHPTLTDVIGLLMTVVDESSVSVAHGGGSAAKRDVLVKLLGGEVIRVCFWQGQMDLLCVESIKSLSTKPVIVVAGLVVKEFVGVKYLSTCSVTKVFFDLDVVDSERIREKYIDDQSLVEFIGVDEAANAQAVLEAEDGVLDELFYAELADVKGKRYRIEAKISEINTSNGWYYEACPMCGVKLQPKNGIFYCPKDGVVTPKFVMQLNVFIDDGSARMEVAVFGGLAESLIGVELSKIVSKPGLKRVDLLDRTKLPSSARDAMGLEYEFIIGVTDQSVRRGYLKYKVFKFTPKAVEVLPSAMQIDLEKGKGKIGESSQVPGVCDVGGPKTPPENSPEFVRHSDPPPSTPISIGSAGSGKRKDITSPDCQAVPTDLFSEDFPQGKKLKKR